MATLPNPTRGVASIVYHYTGDGPTTELFQSVGVNLSRFITAYEKSILLKESGGFDFSGGAENKAWKVYNPTSKNFAKAIVELTNAGYFIDIFILGHGSINRYGNGRFAVKDSKGYWTSNELMNDLSPDKTGYEKLPIRIVGMWTCYGSWMNKAWISVGAKLSFGARKIQYYPQQANAFAKNWTSGKTVKDCLHIADSSSSRTASQTYIVAEALATRNKWGGCPFTKTVLGKHSCSKKFFKWKYIDNDDPKKWPDGSDVSGKDYMNWSSTHFRLYHGSAYSATKMKFTTNCNWS